MSFSEEDIEALGQQLNHMNYSLESMNDNIRMMKNILVAFSLVSAIGFFATFLLFI